MNNIVSLQYLDDYNFLDLKNAVREGFENLNLTNIFKPKMKVLIKVCLPDAVSQDNAETTNPAVVRAVVDYLTKMDVLCIVADCPFKKHTESVLNAVYLNTGMLEMANLTSCELNRDLSTAYIEIPNGVMTKNVTILNIANQVDAIINIGKLKIDDKMGYLGSSSNIFGLIPGEMKNLILNRISTLGDWNNYIIDMYETVKDKVVLNILDGIVAMEANKTQRMLNCLAMGQSAYSVDAVMFDILGIERKNTILKQAESRDLINIEKPYRIVGEKIDKFKVDEFMLVDFDSNTELKPSKAYFKSHQQRVVIDKNKCKGCKICSRICPTNAIIMRYDKNGEFYAEIDYKKCIYCNKCVTACPYSVVEHKTPLAYKVMMKEIQKHNKEQNK